jgi:hypothetical protein
MARGADVKNTEGRIQKAMANQCKWLISRICGGEKMKAELPGAVMTEARRQRLHRGNRIMHNAFVLIRRFGPVNSV